MFKKMLLVASLLATSSLIYAANGMTPGQWLEANNTQIISTNPNYPDYADLASFGKAIGNSRIVVIGEQTHGEGNVYELKNRLVQYLHQKKGFEVFVIESGMYDVAALWDLAQAGSPVAQNAAGRIFYMYSLTKEGRGVLEYVDQKRLSNKPLQLAAFDTPHAGVDSINRLLPELERQLALRQSVILQDSRWASYVRIANVVARLDETPPSPDDMQLFFDISAQLDQAFDDSVASNGRLLDSAGFWRLQAASLRAQACTMWGVNDGETSYWAARDAQGARNIEWLVNRFYPGKKLVVWAHNYHTGAFWGTSMGSFLLQKFAPQDIYLTGFVGYSGQVRDMDNKSIIDVPAPNPNRIEAEWRAAGLPMAFIDFKQRKNLPTWVSTITARPFDYYDGLDSPIAYSFHGLFYIDRPVPATPIQ